MYIKFESMLRKDIKSLECQSSLCAYIYVGVHVNMYDGCSEQCKVVWKCGYDQQKKMSRKLEEANCSSDPIISYLEKVCVNFSSTPTHICSFNMMVATRYSSKVCITHVCMCVLPNDVASCTVYSRWTCSRKHLEPVDQQPEAFMYQCSYENDYTCPSQICQQMVLKLM